MAEIAAALKETDSSLVVAQLERKYEEGMLLELEEKYIPALAALEGFSH